MDIIQLDKVTKSYQSGGQTSRAVDEVTLAIRQGEFVSIVGHSGSGKSTLLSLIGGINQPDSGEIIVDGARILALNDNELSAFRNRTLNFIFQFASLFPTITALENVMLPASFQQGRPEEPGKLRQKGLALLESVGLADKAGAYPSQLSGGQQRRVAIARAFMNDPRILLADEPTGDLDEQTEGEIMQLFREMNRQKGMTMIMVTHNSAIAAQADRTLRMYNGRLESA